MLSLPQNTFRFLLILIGISFCLSVAMTVYVHSYNPEAIFYGDTAKHIELAENILKTGEFRRGIYNWEIRITPGYAVLMAGFMQLFGEQFGFFQVLLQILMFAMTLVPIFLIGYLTFGPFVGLIAAGLYGFDYLSLHLSNVLLTESPMMLFFCSAIAGTIYFLKHKPESIRIPVFVSFAFAFATFFRSVTLYLYAPVLVLLVWAMVRNFRWPVTKVMRFSLAFFLPWFVLIGGWVLINGLKTGVYTYSTAGNYQMMHRLAEVVAIENGTAKKDELQNLSNDFLSRRKNNTPGDQKDGEQARAQMVREYLGKYPLTYAKRAVVGMVRMMFVPSTADFVRYLGGKVPFEGPLGDISRLNAGDFQQKWLSPDNVAFLCFEFMALAYLVNIYAFAMLGLILGLTSGWKNLVTHLLLAGILAYVLLVSGGQEAYARYRLPMMPFIFVYAGYGFTFALRKITPFLKPALSSFK